MCFKCGGHVSPLCALAWWLGGCCIEGVTLSMSYRFPISFYPRPSSHPGSPAPVLVLHMALHPSCLTLLYQQMPPHWLNHSPDFNLIMISRSQESKHLSVSHRFLMAPQESNFSAGGPLGLSFTLNPHTVLCHSSLSTDVALVKMVI